MLYSEREQHQAFLKNDYTAEKQKMPFIFCSSKLFNIVNNMKNSIVEPHLESLQP